MPGDGNGNGNGDGKGAAGDVQQQLTTLQEQMKTQGVEMETLKGAKVDLEQRIDEADKELLSDEYLDFKENKGKGKAAPAEGEGAAGEIDLDRASNREIATFIEKKYKGDMDLAVKDLKGQLDLTKQQIGMMAAQFDVALTTMRHGGGDGKPSFAENQKAIFEIAKTNPKWNAEQCYQQFILQQKAADDEKSDADKKKAEEEEKAATERAGVPGSIVTDKELSKEDAAALAYKKAFGNKE